MAGISKNNLIFNSKKLFIKEYKQDVDIISIAPGRVNIIGEHTDYNDGFSMPTAINKWVVTLLTKRKDKLVKVFSVDYNEKINFNLDDLNINGNLWEKYVKSAIYIIKEKYNLNTGFNILIAGNVPIGFGMSSSAALEVSIVSAILNMCSSNINKYQILDVCNKVENNLIGIKSGMLDQYASIFSKKNKLLLIDFLNLNHKYIDFNINNSCWLLINSMVKRELVDSDYNDRVDECKKAMELIKNKLNNNLTINSLTIENIKCINKNKKLYNRLIHVITENKRVHQMAEAFNIMDLDRIGDLLNESHHSLSKYYEVSCKEIESIIEYSKKHSSFYGGRIMGGGFGGCTLNLIDYKTKDEFVQYVSDCFFKKYKYNLKIEEINFGEGLHFLKK
tara:strand:- start:325 stop:1497 length:1173 start_codon:yes stop_codon:yes gene_type:complete